MSQLRKKDVRQTELPEQEAAEMDHATLLGTVRALAQEMDEYLSRYPATDDGESLSMSPGAPADQPDLDAPNRAANPKPADVASSQRIKDDSTTPKPESPSPSHTSLPVDAHTGNDPKEAPKRIKASFKSDQAPAKVRKTSRHDQDILNADFIAL